MKKYWEKKIENLRHSFNYQSQGGGENPPHGNSPQTTNYAPPTHLYIQRPSPLLQWPFKVDDTFLETISKSNDIFKKKTNQVSTCDKGGNKKDGWLIYTCHSIDDWPWLCHFELGGERGVTDGSDGWRVLLQILPPSRPEPTQTPEKNPHPNDAMFALAFINFKIVIFFHIQLLKDVFRFGCKKCLYLMY